MHMYLHRLLGKLGFPLCVKCEREFNPPYNLIITVKEFGTKCSCRDKYARLFPILIETQVLPGRQTFSRSFCEPICRRFSSHNGKEVMTSLGGPPPSVKTKKGRRFERAEKRRRYPLDGMDMDGEQSRRREKHTGARMRGLQKTAELLWKMPPWSGVFAPGMCLMVFGFWSIILAKRTSGTLMHSFQDINSNYCLLR